MGRGEGSKGHRCLGLRHNGTTKTSHPRSKNSEMKVVNAGIFVRNNDETQSYETIPTRIGKRRRRRQNSVFGADKTWWDMHSRLGFVLLQLVATVTVWVIVSVISRILECNCVSTLVNVSSPEFEQATRHKSKEHRSSDTRPTKKGYCYCVIVSHTATTTAMWWPSRRTPHAPSCCMHAQHDPYPWTTRNVPPAGCHQQAASSLITPVSLPLSRLDHH